MPARERGLAFRFAQKRPGGRARVTGMLVRGHIAREEVKSFCGRIAKALPREHPRVKWPPHLAALLTALATDALTKMNHFEAEEENQK